MEAIFVILGCVVVYMIFKGNSSENSEEVTFTEKRTIRSDGRVHVEQEVRGKISASEARTRFSQATKIADGNRRITEVKDDSNLYVDRWREASRTVIDVKPGRNPEAITYSSPKAERSTLHPGVVGVPGGKAKADVNVKTCGRCGALKSPDDFFKSDKQPDGLSAWCKNCHNEKKSQEALGRYKRCPKCGNNREKWNFFKSKKQPDGLSIWCKPCHKRHG